MINNSVKKCVICNNDKIGEFITINDKKYHLCCIEQQQNNWNELKKLLKEEIDICDGCIDALRSDLQELHPRSCGKTYLQNEILKNKTAKRSFEITLKKMQELEKVK